MRPKQAGFSLIELLIVVAVILIIAAIAIPDLLRSRMAANEASAVASLRSINTSEVVYQSSNNIGYASKLLDLSDGGAAANCVPPTAPTSSSSCLLDAALTSGVKSGYNFTYTPAAGAFVPTYTVNADPVTIGGSGQRHFFSDQTLVVRVNNAAVATVTDPPI
jgi:type IV pilus assembly protein PilA